MIQENLWKSWVVAGTKYIIWCAHYLNFLYLVLCIQWIKTFRWSWTCDSLLCIFNSHVIVDLILASIILVTDYRPSSGILWTDSLIIQASLVFTKAFWKAKFCSGLKYALYLYKHLSNVVDLRPSDRISGEDVCPEQFLSDVHPPVFVRRQTCPWSWGWGEQLPSGVSSLLCGGRPLWWVILFLSGLLLLGPETNLK